MKTTLDHLPAHKQAELSAITKAITSEFKDIEMVILFGSFARGNWVEDGYMKGGAGYTYKSDFDLLIILTTNGKANSPSYTYSINDVINSTGPETTVNPIYHGIDFVNKKLSDGNYFFNDIRKDGIMLYNSGNFNLHDARQLNKEEQKAQAESDFSYWYANASDFMNMFEYAYSSGKWNNAAFQLHQTAERYFAAIHLVYTGYKPKTHDIDVLYKQAMDMDVRLKPVFPLSNDEEKRLFNLLKKAYVDARYEKDYKITQVELEYLNSRVQVLKNLTDILCKEKIYSFTIS